MSTDNMPHIPKEKFNFVQLDTSIHDLKFETKPIGYFKDAWLRFRKNKGAVVAFIVLLLIVFAFASESLFRNLSLLVRSIQSWLEKKREKRRS